MRARAMRGARGFTLIELMSVVTIIAVLLALAVPAYRDAVRNTRRAVAQTCLEEAAQFMERFYTTNLQYHETRTTPATDVVVGQHLRFYMLENHVVDMTASPSEREVVPAK